MLSLITSKIKLVFKYAEFIIIIGLLAALGIKATQAARLKADIAKERAQVVLLKQANEINFQTIETLREWQFNQEQVYLKLDREVAAIRAVADETAANIAELGRTDEASRNYLSTPIPDGIRRVLKRIETESGANDQGDDTGASSGPR